MVPNEKRGKLDAKGTKCLFLGYCEGIKAYRLMCVQSKKIIKCKDVEFMEDNTSVGNDLEMCPSGRNETPNVVIVDTWRTLTWSIGWPSNESFDICKVHCK
jgi:hypothetical protein